MLDLIFQILPAMNRYQLEERIIDYSVIILKIASSIQKTRPGFVLGGQIIKSGTSSALNYGEALGAESKKDFIHRVQIISRSIWVYVHSLKSVPQYHVSYSSRLIFPLRR